MRGPGYVPRFSRVERLLHWVNALGFFFLLATGLILYLPRDRKSTRLNSSH